MKPHSGGVDKCTCVSGLPASFLVLHPVPAVSAVPPLPPLPFPGGAIAHAWLWTVEGTETQLGAYKEIFLVLLRILAAMLDVLLLSSAANVKS